MKVIVKGDCLYPHPADSTEAIRVDSAEWFNWLAEHDRFVYREETGQGYTARRETRRGGYFWYAYRRQAGKLQKVYLGKTADLTLDKLIAANTRLAGGDNTTPAMSSSAAPFDLDVSLRQAVAGADHQKHMPEVHIPFALTARVTPPALPAHLVNRPHLLRQINTPITLITAPSGFGKTTLLNQWRTHFRFPISDFGLSIPSAHEIQNPKSKIQNPGVAWLSLEADENSVYAFWTAIGVALQQLAQALSPDLSLFLQTPVAPPIESFLAGLIHHLSHQPSAQPNRRLVLIIDNYQRVKAPEIDVSCQFFLDRLPETVQVILASQEPFPFAIHRWRSQGILTELSTDDLRLTPDESVAWLNQALAVPLTDREKLSLALRVEGWSAGLNLLALALKKQADVHRFVATFEGYHPYLQAYFVEEILQKHPADWQTFLLQTSILKNLNGSLCDAVTAQTGSEQILRQLYRANQFITLVDEDQGWYQYHDLFAQALQGQLHQQFPQQAPALHRRAAAWYQAHELYTEAVQHLLQVNAWAEVTHLIDRVILAELSRGIDHRVLKWLQQRPIELFEQHDTLLLTYVRLATPSLPYEQIESLLNRIAARLEVKPPAAQTSAQQTLLTALNKWKQTGILGNFWGTRTEPPQNEMAQLEEMLDLMYQAFYQMKQGDISAGEKALMQAIEKGKAAGIFYIVLVAGGRLAMTWAEQGRLRHSETLIHDILRWTLAKTGSLPVSASVSLLALGRIHYARNKIVTARQYIDHSVMLDPHPTSTNIMIHYHVLLAYISHQQGDKTAAHEALRAALDLGPTGEFTLQALQIHQALLYLRQGDAVTAERLLRRISDYPLPAQQAGDGLLRVAWAELFLAQQQDQAAEALLTPMDWARLDPFLSILPYPNLLLALAYWGQHKVNRAYQEMLRAIRLAEPEGIIRPFLDGGFPLIPVLTFVLHAGKLNRAQHNFVTSVFNQLRMAYPETPAPSPAEVAAWFVSAQISPREQEILRLLDEGLDNRALAARLMVTDSTVRTHLRNIYRKLGVSTRIQALKRAQELQLLGFFDI